MPAGLERDVQELYDYVNELINTAESRGNKCINNDACEKITTLLYSYASKIEEKALNLEDSVDILSKEHEYYDKIYNLASSIIDTVDSIRSYTCVSLYSPCVRWRDLLPHLRRIQGDVESMMEYLKKMPGWQWVLRRLLKI